MHSIIAKNIANENTYKNTHSNWCVGPHKKGESKIKTSLIIQLKKSLVMLARMDAGGSVKRRLAFDQEANWQHFWKQLFCMSRQKKSHQYLGCRWNVHLHFHALTKPRRQIRANSMPVHYPRSPLDSISVMSLIHPSTWLPEKYDISESILSHAKKDVWDW